MEQKAEINVLLVDDRPDNLTVLEAVLGSCNYNLVRALSGDAAVRLAREMEFAVILLDVQMPGKDGFVTAREIRKEGASANSPIIFVTAIYGEEIYINLGYAVGAVDYIFKPFNPYILRSKVAVFCDLYEKTRNLLIQSEQLRETEKRLQANETMQWQKKLADAGASLASMSLDYEKTLTQIARIAVENYCSWCEVFVLSRDSALKRRFAYGGDGTSFQDIVSKETFNVIRARVIQNNKLEMFAEAEGKRRYVCVPLYVRGLTLGTVTMGFAEGLFRLGDLPSIEEFTRRSALAIDNAILYRKAEKAIQTRDEFLSIASHELRTPLTPLKLQLQSIHKIIREGRIGALSLDKLAKTVERSNRQVDRLNNLIGELLSVARINLGRLDLALEPCDAGGIVKSVVEQFADQAGLSGKMLTIEADQSVVGEWDPAKLEQVIVNLLTNAIKYGQGKPVRVGVKDAGENVVIFVEDQGIGISPEDHRRIFDLFERTRMARNYGGLGLGLYIVNKIVKEHGGSIRVISELGEGARFELELPKFRENGRKAVSTQNGASQMSLNVDSSA